MNLNRNVNHCVSEYQVFIYFNSEKNLNKCRAFLQWYGQCGMDGMGGPRIKGLVK